MSPAQMSGMNVSRLAVLLFFVAAGCVVPGDAGEAEVSSNSQPGEIAFEMAEPNEMAMIVPVMIDGKGPYDFVLDTGATLTCVAESLASELALDEPRGMLGRGATLGGGGPMRLVQIDSIVVGTIEVNDVTACAIDLSDLENFGLEIDGLLGLNVLTNFRVTIDFERQILRLEPLTAS